MSGLSSGDHVSASALTLRLVALRLENHGAPHTAGSGASVSVGVAHFDGRGNVTRSVRVNSGAPDGERVLIDITSVGTYEVNEDGTGVIEFTNTLPSGNTADVTFDFVIIRSMSQRVRGSLVGAELSAIQREPGVTASPVKDTFYRR